MTAKCARNSLAAASPAAGTHVCSLWLPVQDYVNFGTIKLHNRKDGKKSNSSLGGLGQLELDMFILEICATNAINVNSDTLRDKPCAHDFTLD
ncbi:hypothetical protein EVAR_23931_1 [Eumeta japonica]|uniref:Uncharacterized protein n=1 Tax=Eumeta variegata TaxID=151549 RepID=A0A4C1V1W0_EUMVA|nr:hypothetical protein EVAR_23931_1 [Eumeta japonica]